MAVKDSSQVSGNNIITIENRSSSKSQESVGNTILVAFFVSLVCSVMVSTSVILLRPRQMENQLIDSGLSNVVQLIESIENTSNRDEIIDEIDTRILDLESGEFVSDIEPAQFNPRTAATDPALSIAIPPELDIAKIERRARYAMVNLIKENDRVKYIVLPVYGAGMWSRLYGYIALEADGNTIAGLNIYEHAETPGIGDKVEDAAWLEKWQGKKVYSDDDKAVIEIVKGKVNARTSHQVDALTGATMTGEGVTHMLRYWFGNHGFKTFLQKVRNKGEET